MIRSVALRKRDLCLNPSLCVDRYMLKNRQIIEYFFENSFLFEAFYVLHISVDTRTIVYSAIGTSARGQRSKEEREVRLPTPALCSNKETP